MAAPSGRATLTGNVPSWAKSANFKAAANQSDSIGFRVYLGWNNPSAVESLAKSVSDPRSASYGHYLTPQQFRQQFAPSQVQVNAVQSWLKSQGFTLDYTPLNNHYVAAEGTVAQAASAFGTTFGTYRVAGTTLRSPSSDISMPSSIAGFVSGVVGLDESAALVHPDIAAEPGAPPSAAFVNAPPCSHYWAEKTTNDLNVTMNNPPGYTLPLPMAPCGYTPGQIRGVYGVSTSGLQGNGQTVAIIDAYASPTIQQDLDQWSQNRGLASTRITQVVAPGTMKRPENKRQDPQGWYGEETLDVQAVHGMAPAASIVYVGAPNNYQDLGVAQDNGRAIETGWGTYTSSLNPGTGAWSTPSWLYGAGGGVSRLFAEPSYQSAVVPSSVFMAQGRTGRALPDIAAFGDPNTGYLIG